MDSYTHSRQAVALPSTRGDKRRARILTAFHDCIISNSHLLYYFSGKDTLLEHYFDNVAQTIIERIESFRTEVPERQFELLADLFFAGKGITRSEIGFMLECFGVAVHDNQLRDQKTELDRICKTYLSELFEQSPCGPAKARSYAELSYAMLIGLRTAAYFDERLGLPRARRLFYHEMLNLAGFRQRD